MTVEPLPVSPQLAAVAAVGLRGYLRALDAAGRAEPAGLTALVSHLTRLADTNRHAVVTVDASDDHDAVGDLLPVATVARLLRVSTRTVERRVATGALPVVRDGRVIRVRTADFARYLEEHVA